MNKLAPPDSYHLDAAEGWLQLGDHLEANAELEKIAPENRAHPDVLQLRWQVYAKEKRWDACLDIATALTKMVPDRRFGWIHRAFSLHMLGRSHEAIDCLLAVMGKFESNATMPYYLARFYCQTGQLIEARQWLGKAFELTGSPEEQKRLKLKALEESDLAPLWKATGEA